MKTEALVSLQRRQRQLEAKKEDIHIRRKLRNTEGVNLRVKKLLTRLHTKLYVLLPL